MIIFWLYSSSNTSSEVYLKLNLATLDFSQLVMFSIFDSGGKSSFIHLQYMYENFTYV